MTSVLQRANKLALVCLVAAFAEAGLVVSLGAAADEQVSPLNVLLLFIATAMLGAAWALRQDQNHPAGGESPALLVALVQAVATALFVSPRMWMGPSGPAVLTLAVSLLAAPLIERACGRFVWPADRRSAPCRRGLVTAAPPIALALIATLVVEDPMAFAVIGAGLVTSVIGGVWVGRTTAQDERDGRLTLDYLKKVEVRVDMVGRPPTVKVAHAALAELHRGVRQRIDEVARETEHDGRARTQIAKARELRTRFMAAMSHELRSPLNSIVGFAQLLEQGLDGELTKGQLESVVMVRRSSEELILLLTDVLDVAMCEANRMKLHREWTPSVEILTDAVRRGRRIVEGRDVDIEAELQPGLPPVYVDQRRIVQAVVALFRSAALSLSGTTIRLRARVDTGPPGPIEHLRVEVHDAIGAIAGPEVERIFEAFREIAEPAGRQVGGLGMPLALCRELVRLHGGDVWAHSSQEAGTVLCVALPLDDSRR